MKKSLVIFASLLAIFGCTKKYELNTNFEMPTELKSPGHIILDVTSPIPVQLSWSGGGAYDGGIVLYDVLFDKKGGDFSQPVHIQKSDLGAGETLTLTHAQLNIIARRAGVKPKETSEFIWTVRGSKGGVSKVYDGYATLKVTRGEGIDNMPEHLYLQGSSVVEKGQVFRNVEEGVFQIYTKVKTGKLYFSSDAAEGAGTSYGMEDGKLVEKKAEFDYEAPETGLARITVDFNTLGFKTEAIDQKVRCIWGANYNDIAVLEYAGNGEFVGDGDVVFLGPGRDGTPDWCSWVEERYYFIAQVDGAEKCWGSSLGGNAYTPDGSEEFFYVYEHEWSQWDNLWKMDHAFDLCHVTFTINTNKDNHMTHYYTGGAIEYKQPTVTPTELLLSGGEADNQAMRKGAVKLGDTNADQFVLYNKFSAGDFTLVDAEGQKYFADADGKLFIGARKTAVAASEGVTRVVVDFKTNTVSFENIGDKVWVENAWDHIVMAELSYQGLGRWAGDGQIKFAGSGDERYSMRTTVNGTQMRWGSDKGNDGKLPETDEEWYVYESEWEGHQWDNLYKFNKADQDKDATFQIDGNNSIHMTHSVTVKTGDPVPPTTAPSALALYGTGAETAGQAFRKVKDGVFSIVARLSVGDLYFQGDGKNYFVDAEKGLLEGEGKGTAEASAANHVSRITINFATLAVTVESVDEYVHLKYSRAYGKPDIAMLQYAGNGVFTGDAHPVWITDFGFPEERYYFVVSIDGTEKCWGRLDGVTDQKPDGSENFYNIEEFPLDDWSHLWKFKDEEMGKDLTISINTNDNGVWKHIITVK